MEIERGERAGALLLTVHGTPAPGDAQALGELLLEAIEAHRPVLVECAGSAELDPACVRVLHRSSHHLPLALVSAHPTPARPGAPLLVTASRDEALAALRARR